MDKIKKDLRSFIACQIREGFSSAHEIINSAKDYAFEQHGLSDIETDIKRITKVLVEEHQAEQATWHSATDCDQLDEAFAALNRQGIVARQNFSCCNNCGFSEIWDEIEEQEKCQPVDGYVFYHLQCTEHVIESGQLLLAYGCVEEDEQALNLVVGKIIAELKRVGLKASWQGSMDYPIVVTGFEWRRRRDDGNGEQAGKQGR